jgi:phospholipid/cholesterol/gamma-HCH transport system permease protein
MGKECARSMPHHAQIVVDSAENRVTCSGDWDLRTVPEIQGSINTLSVVESNEVKVDCAGISAMDSAGVIELRRLLARIEASGAKPVLQGLRAELEGLVRLVEAHAGKGPPLSVLRQGALWKLGARVVRGAEELFGAIGFVGEIALFVPRIVARPARLRWRTILRNIEQAGFNALPIVGLLSFLMGIVIAYQGAEQLRRYGANIFVADLVGLSMLRELSPLLTAIIIAGRSGSAYTAQIGTMKVTEEIDALRTIGIPPMELLVIPKVIALLIALPLLTVYADVLGVLGGMITARSQLGVGFTDFIERFGTAVSLSSYMIGIGKAPVFAGIVAVIGCYQGFRVVGGADSVGRQTTISVVQAIFLVIIADAWFSVVFSWLQI